MEMTSTNALEGAGGQREVAKVVAKAVTGRLEKPLGAGSYGSNRFVVHRMRTEAGTKMVCWDTTCMRRLDWAKPLPIHRHNHHARCNGLPL